MWSETLVTERDESKAEKVKSVLDLGFEPFRDQTDRSEPAREQENLFSSLVLNRSEAGKTCLRPRKSGFQLGISEIGLV